MNQELGTGNKENRTLIGGEYFEIQYSLFPACLPAKAGSIFLRAGSYTVARITGTVYL